MTSTAPGAIPTDHVRPAQRLLRRALRFWPAALATLVIVGGLVAAGLFLLPKKYKSEASLLYREGLQWQGAEPLNARRVGPRLREMLLSRSMLSKVVEEQGLYPRLVAAGRIPEAAEEMRQSTTFRYDQSDVFVIAYLGTSPAEARRVTARLAELLLSEHQRLQGDQAQVARRFLEAERNRAAEELAAKEAGQLRFLAKHPEFAEDQGAAVGVGLRARPEPEPLAATGPSPAATDAALTALRREEERLRQQLGSQGLVAAEDLAQAATQANAAMIAAQRELAEVRSMFTEEHPDVRRAAARVAETEQEYRRAIGALNAAQTPVPPSELRERLSRVQAEIQNQQRTSIIQTPTPRRSPARGPARLEPAAEAEWARLSREVSEARSRLQALEQRQFTASMTASMLTSGQTARLDLIEPAYLPARPVGASPKKLAALGLFVSLMLACGVALALAAFDDLVYDGQDVERLRVAPVLVEVPWKVGRPRPRAPDAGAQAPPPAARAERAAPGAARDVRRIVRALPQPVEEGAETGEASRAIVRRSPQAEVLAIANGGDGTLTGPFGGRSAESALDLVRIHRVTPSDTVDPRILMPAPSDDPAAAAFRVLRHRLREKRRTTVVLVASPRAGEGKTSTAVNLALALGEEGGTRVLLLEANFRRPAVATVLGFQPPVSITEQLEVHRTRPLAPWVVVETMPWLHTAAVTMDAVGSTLDGRSFALCIEDMREAGYDYIVIDGPSVLESADANVLAERVDGVLLTTWARRSRARHVRSAVDQLGAAKLLGFVVLGTWPPP